MSLHDIICPECSVKAGKTVKAGLYKHNINNLWQITCLTCGWSTEPFKHPEDIGLPTKQELKDNFR